MFENRPFLNIAVRHLATVALMVLIQAGFNKLVWKVCMPDHENFDFHAKSVEDQD